MNKTTSYFNISERKLLLRVIDISILIFSLWLANIYLNFNYFEFSNPSIYLWNVILIIYFLLFGEIFLLFNLNVSNNRYLVVRSLVLTAFFTTIFYIFTPFISPSLPENRLQIVYFFLIISGPILIWRYIYMWLIFSPKYFKNIVFIGKSDRLQKMLHQVNEDNFHNIRAYISDKEVKNISGFKDILKIDLTEFISKDNTTEIIVSLKDLSKQIVEKLNKELILLFEYGVNIKSYESFYEEVTDRVPREYLDYNFYKHINFSKNNTNRSYIFTLRVFDIFISIIGIILFLILIPFLFFGNLIANRGPFFYTQERVGKNGNNFKIYKLRSMIKNAEKDGAVWADKNDKRITFFGNFLRRTRLDEVPQFYNILKGDMSLIGPRPERPEFVNDLEKKIPFYTIRHVVKPGLTGWAQVKYPYANTLEEQETKLRYDLYYIKERNSFLDFKILIKTFTTVLFFKGQ